METYRILHMLDRSLTEIEDFLPEIYKRGFNAVQISPLQKCKINEGNAWYYLYQPLGFEIGNRIGTERDLERLCRAAEKYGIIIVADVVINHVANKNDVECLIPHPDVDKDLLNNKDCFKERKPILNWDDRWQVTHYCMGLPGLNPNHPLVQEKVRDMFIRYANLGVNGLRLDAAKSIALPSEGCEFFPKVLDPLPRWLPLVYGEVLGADSYLIDDYAQYMKVLTDRDHGDKEKIISFHESADSRLSRDLGYTKYESNEKVIREYISLVRKGYPNTILYARIPFLDGETEIWKDDAIEEVHRQYKKVI